MNLLLAADEDINPLVPTLSEIILVLVIFGIIWYVVAKFVVPNFEKTFKLRRDAIEGGIARAEQAQAEAQRMLEQYQQQLAEARAEAAQIRERRAGRGAAHRRGAHAPRRRRSRPASSPAARSSWRRSGVRSCVSCGPRSAHWPSSCRRRSSTSDWPRTPRSGLRSTAFLADLQNTEAASRGAGSPS